jgi:DNA (cytosine-5)-methyltransferase 1
MNYKQTESGLYIPEHYKPYPTGFDFFCGCGGFSLGFIQAGFEVVGALEWSTDASHTYMRNLGAYPMKIHYSSEAHKNRLENYFEKNYKKLMKEGKDIKTFSVSGGGWIKTEREMGHIFPPVKNFFFGDIIEYSGLDILEKLGMKPGELDVIFGGPPCQGFSRANSNSKEKKTTDPRNALVFHFARMIVEMQPKMFCMENVPDILNMYTPTGTPVIHQFLKIIEDGNYMSYEAGLKALGIAEKELGKKLRAVPVVSSMKPKKKAQRKKKIKKVKQLGLKFTKIITNENDHL